MSRPAMQDMKALVQFLDVREELCAAGMTVSVTPENIIINDTDALLKIYQTVEEFNAAARMWLFLKETKMEAESHEDKKR